MTTFVASQFEVSNQVGAHVLLSRSSKMEPNSFPVRKTKAQELASRQTRLEESPFGDRLPSLVPPGYQSRTPHAIFRTVPQPVSGASTVS
jgi:hypothetical protein